MTLKVKKSDVAGVDFPALVAAHIAALEKHEQHMAVVRAQADKPTEERTHEAYPPPGTHPLVGAAVRRVATAGGTTFVPDYEVENDDPTPEEALRERKAALMAEVSKMEAAAAAAVDPPAKRRLNAIRHADAAKKEKADRTADDIAIIASDEKTRRKLDAIERHGAEANAAIDDLTEETVKDWKTREFPR